MNLVAADLTIPSPPASALWVSGPRFLHKRLRIRRGIGRVVMRAARSRPTLHLVRVATDDGRYLHLDLRESMCMPYLLEGRIWEEAGETAFVRAVVRSGETAIDVGANVGWYSSLLAERVGPKGKVIAFEPNPVAVRLLRALARDYAQLEVVPSAVGDHPGVATLHVPNDAGAACVQPVPGVLRSLECPALTLDGFLRDSGVGDVTFVKCDAEGAELPILRGARELISRPSPPIWMLEISTPAARRFGYEPQAIAAFFASCSTNGYRGYRIHSQTRAIVPLPDPIDFRFDAVFVPAWLQERVDAYAASVPQQA